MSDKLLFFNNKGYPYNFDYNADEDYYSATLFFDENSSDTFKTIALYVFEKVDPISFNANLTMDEFSVFDTSGISFRNASYSGETITNITRVNSASGFYSKWIAGDKFDEKFPIGSFVSLSNTSMPSFSDIYYQVVGNEPGSILINNSIANNKFTGVTYVSGGTIYAHNVILFDDYSNGLFANGGSGSITLVRIPVYPTGFQSITVQLKNGATIIIDFGTITGVDFGMETLDQIAERIKNQINIDTITHNITATRTGHVINCTYTGDHPTYVGSSLYQNNTYLFYTSTVFIGSYFTAPYMCSEKLTEFNNYLIAKQATGSTIKTSIVGSEFNDQVTEIINITSASTYCRTFDLSGATGDELNVEITLYTQRPKIYIGPATFSIFGTSATITLDRRLNSSINLYENQQIIFETYDNRPINDSNPIFTINDGILEDDIYRGTVSFYAIENLLATKFYKFGKKGLSEKTYIASSDSVKSIFPKSFKVYDYYIEFTGDTSELINDLKVGDHIILSAVTSISGVTLHEDREFSVKQIIDFKAFRINYWTQRINNDPNWFKMVVDKAIKNGETIQQQTYDDALWMYENYDQNLQPSTVIQVNEYVINETGNQYNIKRIFGEEDIRDLECTCSVSLISGFTANVIGYTTSNVINLPQVIDTDYKHTIDLFNNQYSSYLAQYGIIAYYQSASTAQMVIESTCPFFNYQYFDAKVELNNNLLKSGATNSIPVLILEVNDTLTNENVYIYQTGETAKDYHGEIYFNLVDNYTTNAGFTVTVNDIEYFNIFTGYTYTSLNSFVTNYGSIFNNLGLTLSTKFTSGYTLDSSRIGYWIDYISGNTTLYLSAYTYAIQISSSTYQEIYNEAVVFNKNDNNTLVIDGLYPDVRVYNVEAKVNEFSSYNIIKNEYNKFIVVDSTSLNSSSLNYFTLELSTGMIIDITGSSYQSNNGEYNIIGLTPYSIDLSYQGPFFAETGKSYSVHTHQFLRKPRGTYGKDIYYNFRFGNPHTNDIFFYDFTGEHLQPYLGNEAVRYKGPTPLWDKDNPCNNDNIYLQFEPNKDENYVNDRTKQQTAWYGDENDDYSLKFKLPRYDSSENYNYVPEPLQVFLGFNSQNEGVSETAVRMDQVENVIFSGYTNRTSGPNFTFTNNGLLTIINNNFNFDWHNYGFDNGQQITIDFIDQASTGTTIFPNIDTYTIGSLNRKKLQLSGVTGLYEFNSSGSTYQYLIKVQPKKVLRLRLYGETEIEDERFRVNIRNLGLNLNFDDEAIFRESDINEDGVDYILLNRKRKELLLSYTEIYNYVGAYKALMNAINFFGYNELQVYEYYRNINPFSPLYKKLHKVLIPDIFDNSIKGYNPQNYIKEKYAMYSISGNTGKEYKKTNLFNLTYRITDQEGNNVTLFSLREVQIKLNKLKRWLKRNVIPLSANILDITGVADTVCQKYMNFDVSNQITKSIVEELSTRINFVYSLTQSMDTNYLVEINFYVHSTIVPDSWTCKIQTFSKDLSTGKLIPQQYHKLLKTDLEDYSFNIDKNNDQYMYIETCYFNEHGVGMVYNKMTNTSTMKNYILINNNFTIPEYNYLNVGNLYYWYDNDGWLYTTS